MSTGKTADHFRRWLILIITVALVTLLVMSGVAFKLWSDAEESRKASRQATAEAEELLTAIYGAEVRTAIENFESRWLTLASLKDPSRQSDVATGLYLDYFGHARAGDAIYNDPFWLTTKSVVVGKVDVLEYSPQRFKAVACVVKMVDKTTTSGVFIESLPSREFQGVYVFVREENAWKLVGFFEITDPRSALRDWDHAPDWLRQVIGDLPIDAVRDCEDYTPK